MTPRRNFAGTTKELGVDKTLRFSFFSKTIVSAPNENGKTSFPKSEHYSEAHFVETSRHDLISRANFF